MYTHTRDRVAPLCCNYYEGRRPTTVRAGERERILHALANERPELSFLLFAFFGIFPVAPSIVSRFVIVVRERASEHCRRRRYYVLPAPMYASTATGVVVGGDTRERERE